MNIRQINLPLTGTWMDEQNLLSRAKRGDEAAFAELVRRFERPVLGVCLRILGANGEAEEAAQEVLFKLFRSLGKLDEERAVEPWLFRVAINECRDRLRRRRPTRILTQPLASPEDSSLLVVLADVRKAIEQLPDRERAALLLREVEGLETEEVAVRMGVSALTVRSQISRARARLRQLLGGAR